MSGLARHGNSSALRGRKRVRVASVTPSVLRTGHKLSVPHG